MALDLKTFGTRTLSAIVFVILFVGSILFNYFSFSIFFFIIALLGVLEFFKLGKHLSLAPYKVTGIIGSIICYLAFFDFEYAFNLTIKKDVFVLLLVLVPILIFTEALFSKREKSLLNACFTIAGILYTVLPITLLHKMVFVKAAVSDLGISKEFFGWNLLCVILLIWSNDTFAYIGGSLFGKNKMIPRVSPGKTWEGTLFGILITFGLSFLIKQFSITANNNFLWILLGLLVPILATIGDLVESLLKREAGVKDSGKLMPGHGGVLDRFDSILFVSPVCFFVLEILK